jgi:ornithine cyclodeaminase
MAKADGLFGDEHILAEIGEVLIGQHTGRIQRDEITLFKSLGLAVEDLAAAHHSYQRAVDENAGTRVELGGGRD